MKNNILSILAIILFAASTFLIGSSIVLVDILDILTFFPLLLSLVGFAGTSELMSKAQCRKESIATIINSIFE